MYCHPNRIPPWVFFGIILCFHFVTPTLQKKQGDKYSKEANTKPIKGKGSDEDTQITNFKELVKPFRMNKLNVVWDKAVHVSFSFSLCQFLLLFL